MGFYLYTGNSLEELVREKLCKEMISTTFSDPFIREQIVIPNQGVASWLKQQIALNSGICANIDFILLNEFTNRLLKTTL